MLESIAKYKRKSTGLFKKKKKTILICPLNIEM